MDVNVSEMLQPWQGKKQLRPMNWFFICDDLIICFPARVPPAACCWPGQCAHHLRAAGGAGHGGAHRGHRPGPLGPLPPCQCEALAPGSGPGGRLQSAHSRGHPDEGPRSPGEKVNTSNLTFILTKRIWGYGTNTYAYKHQFLVPALANTSMDIPPLNSFRGQNLLIINSFLLWLVSALE